MTYRERRERKAERLHEWADKREAKAEAGYERASEMASVIPAGQPILVDHYSAGRDRRYRDRISRTYERSFEDADKAKDMRSRAEGIEDQLASSIYDDDPDAIKALRARIAGLEAEREGIKAYNRSCRKGSPDPSLLNERQRAYYLDRPDLLPANGSLPSYVLSNLGGRITKARQRLARLERKTQ